MRSIKSMAMCNLYSITTNQAAILALLRVLDRYVGNLPLMSGVHTNEILPPLHEEMLKPGEVTRSCVMVSRTSDGVTTPHLDSTSFYKARIEHDESAIPSKISVNAGLPKMCTTSGRRTVTVLARQTHPFEVQEATSKCRKCIALVAISDWDHPTLWAVGIVIRAPIVYLICLS
jgi:hypothetical protein